MFFPCARLPHAQEKEDHHAPDSETCRKGRKEKAKAKFCIGRDALPKSLHQKEKNTMVKAFWESHRDKWTEAEPALKSIVDTSQKIEGHTHFLLGCVECMAYQNAHPDEKAFARCPLAVGKQSWVKRDTIVRHLKSAGHQKAVTWHREAPGAGLKENLAEDPREDVPSAAQMRIGYGLCKESILAATGAAYEKACAEAIKSGDPNVPASRCSKPMLAQIANMCGTAVLHDQHRRLAGGQRNKNAPKWMCVAEDDSAGFAQKVLRVAFKDYSVADILLDWKHHDGKKSALWSCNGKPNAP